MDKTSDVLALVLSDAVLIEISVVVANSDVNVFDVLVDMLSAAELVVDCNEGCACVVVDASVVVSSVVARSVVSIVAVSLVADGVVSSSVVVSVDTTSDILALVPSDAVLVVTMSDVVVDAIPDRVLVVDSDEGCA